MKHECSIVRDLLPLYAENMVSGDTSQFVKAHLDTCAECRKIYEDCKQPQITSEPEPEVPLTSLRRKLMIRKIQTILFTAITVIALLVSAFAVLDAPAYYPYTPELLSITENEDQSISITFDKAVTDYSCRYVPSPDASTPSHYSIEAWSSQWDKWFSNRGTQTVTLQPRDDSPLSVYYISNNGEEDVCIYGQELVQNGGMVTLPRLALVYYLEFAVIFFGAMLIVWFVVRRKTRAKIWVERIALYPACYGLSHLIVVGFPTVSYSMTRDFALIVFISILLYCGALLAHNLIYLRKEIAWSNRK